MQTETDTDIETGTDTDTDTATAGEVFAEFDFASPPPFPEALMPDEATLQSLHQIEMTMQGDEDVLPGAPVSDFPSPMMTVMFSLHRTPLLSAQSAVTAVLAQAGSRLPRGSKVDRAAESLRPVFVPRWLLKGEIHGAWQAQGILTSNWEVDCTQCFGTGKVGVGTKQRDCEGCWGTGKQKQVKKEAHVEQGEGSVTLLDSEDNNGTGVALELAPVHEELPWLLPEEERLRMRCLRPAGIYSSTALDHLKNRLASLLEAQSRETLKQYARLESFLFDPDSVRSQSAVAVWLYPAYVGHFHVPEAKGYVICDALSGKANWALGLPSEQAHVGSVTKLPLIAGGVAVAAAAGGAAAWYFLK